MRRMYGIVKYIWLELMENEGTYSIHGAYRNGTTLFLIVDSSSNGCSFSLSCYIIMGGYRSNGKLFLMLQKSYRHEMSSGKYPEFYTMGFTMSQNSVQDFYHKTYHGKRTIRYLIYVKGSDFLSHVWRLTSYGIQTQDNWKSQRWHVLASSMHKWCKPFVNMCTSVCRKWLGLRSTYCLRNRPFYTEISKNFRLLSICRLKGFKGTTFLTVKVIANSGDTLGCACGFIYWITSAWFLHFPIGHYL